jgi:hypothetical protein
VVKNWVEVFFLSDFFVDIFCDFEGRKALISTTAGGGLAVLKEDTTLGYHLELLLSSWDLYSLR